MTNYTGTSGDDKLVGDWRDDEFDITQDGADTVLAGGGDDLISDGASSLWDDHIVGGAGSDTAVLWFNQLDVSASFDGDNLSGVERLLFVTPSFISTSFTVTIGDGVATPDLKNGVLEIDDGADGSGSLTVDCSAETDTSLLFRGTDFNETFYGGAMGDTFDLVNTAGVSAGFGGGGDDVFLFSQGTFTSNSAAIGGDGNDRVEVHGDEPFLDIVLRAQNLSGIETLWLESAKRVVFADGNLANKATMTVDGSSATTGMTLDASHETRSGYHLIGGAGADKLTGGGGRDTIEGGLGKDVLTGGAKADHFVISALTTVPATITDLTGQDVIDLTAIDADVGADGDQRFKLVSAFTGKAGQAMLSYDAAHDVTSLLLDVNGDGTVDGVLRIDGDATSFTHFQL